MYFILYFVGIVPTCLSKQNRLISGKPPSQATASARPAHLVTLVQGGSYHSEKMRKAGSRQEKVLLESLILTTYAHRVSIAQTVASAAEKSSVAVSTGISLQRILTTMVFFESWKQMAKLAREISGPICIVELVYLGLTS